MMKVLFQGLGLALMLFEFCMGVQTKTMRIKRFINPDSAIAKLEYHIGLFQDSFFLYAPVAIRLWVKNLTSDTVQVWFDETKGWFLKDKDGRQYHSTVSILYGGPRVIQPGDSLGGLANLSDYGIKIPGAYPSPALPVGKYEVYYKIDEDSTEPVSFSVVEPKDEESKALELFLEAFSPINGEKFSRGTSEQRIALYKEHAESLLRVVDRFPKSIYAVDAISCALSAAWGVCNNLELANQINNRILHDYPDSRLNGFAFLKSYYKDKPAVLRAVLDSIIKANSHPRITAGAKATLKELGSEK